MSADGPGRREVAHRVFAAEYDDATFSYSESDEERAPNYVVTPTGLRVNRLFVVGVLTEVERVGDDVLRGRIVDPTGAFVAYAGQYQPDEQAFLDSATPPAFVALTGKARTFQPEDSDRVYTSIRPESINEVDADTRDRWVVKTAEATLARVATVADALESGARGERLGRALRDNGVPESLAAGVPLALERYGTTTTYLDAVRRLAVDALEVVADDREEVRALNVAPDAPGDVTLGPLPAALGDGDLTVPEEPDEPDAAEATAATGAGVETEPAASASESDPASAEPESTSASEPESASSPEPAAEADPAAGETDAPAEPESSDDASEAAEAGTQSGTLGDFDPGPSLDDDEDEAEDDVAFDPDEDVLDDEEREEIESEFGTEFETGTEVNDAGEAGIDVPDVDELEADLDDAESESDVSDAESETEVGDARAVEETPEPSETPESAEADGAETDAEVDAETESESDLDLETAAVEAMADLDDGDGAAHDEVVAALVDEYGVDPGDAEDAIQDALMSGQCYEPSEGTLKAI